MPTGTLKQHRLHLIADIGGTHARFALCTSVHTIQKISVMAVADFPAIDDAIVHYLHSVGDPQVRHAVIGIANPVLGDHVKMTNFPWEFSIEATRKSLGFEKLHVINDFTAQALALPYLTPEDLLPIGGGLAVAATPLGVLGPGTGLGVSALIPTAKGSWLPLAAEGGHVSFAPSDDLEMMLWQEACKEFGHVSMERLVSGSGLQFIYRKLCQRDGAGEHDYSPADISHRAIANTCAYCREALDTFCAILGTAASDLAVTLGARGGIYIGGGIIPKLGSYFPASPFRARFNAKGRFSDYLAAIPVFVIVNDKSALLGAAAHLDAYPDE